MYLLRLRRVNWGLGTGLWRVYERRVESNGVRLVLSIDSSSIAALEKLNWRPISGLGLFIFTALGVKPEGGGRLTTKKRMKVQTGHG
jgi:hypothetical protein